MDATRMGSKQDQSPLLSLPVELFQQIIQDFVELTGIKRAAECRLVNKTFAVNINDKSVEALARKPFTEILKDFPLRRFFTAQSSAVLFKKALDCKSNDEGLIKIIREVSIRVEKRIGDDSLSQPGVHYISGICNSLSTLRPARLFQTIKESLPPDTISESFIEVLLPAVASSIHGRRLIKQTLGRGFLIYSSESTWFPHVLSAAVASDNIHALQEYLDYALNVTNMVRAMNGISEALGAAIRLHRNKAGDMIFDFFNENTEFTHLVPNFTARQLFNDAVRYGNTALYYRVFELRKSDDSANAKDSAYYDYELSTGDLEYLLKYGKKSILTMLLRNMHFNPNQLIHDTMPLQFVLDCRRRDLAAVLLSHGANPHAPSENGICPLWHAITLYHDRDVRLMLAHGGDAIKAGIVDAWRLERFKRSYLFRLSQTQEGRELILRSDLTLQDLRNFDEAQQTLSRRGYKKTS